MTTAQRLAMIEGFVSERLDGCHDDAKELWLWLLAAAPNHSNASKAIRERDVVITTVNSRMGRAGLPSTKKIITGIRLALLAGLFDDRDRTTADAAYTLNFASPQSLNRHLREVRGMTATEYRETVPFNVELDRMLDELLDQHMDAWRKVRPFDGYRLSGMRTEPRRRSTCPTCGAVTLEAA